MIEQNLEKKKKIVEQDWDLLDEQNEVIKKITASKLVFEFEEFEKKVIEKKLSKKKNSWFNNLIEFLFK